MNFRSIIRRILNKAGYDVMSLERLEGLKTLGPHTFFDTLRTELIKNYKIDLVLDIGANEGQDAEKLRKNGYQGRIVSFEPLTSAFTLLKKRAESDSLWNVVNSSLGDQNIKARINISENSCSSSLLEILPRHLNAAPESAFVGSEEITVQTLDYIFYDFYNPGESVFLKIDTQGYERKILEGACRSLKSIIGIQLEMSLVTLYKGECLFEDMFSYMTEKGYTLMSLEPEWTDRQTGQLLQVNGIFFRE
jgi:FkbM family methyltransferase